MLNLSFERELWTQISELNYEQKLWTKILNLHFDYFSLIWILYRDIEKCVTWIENLNFE